MVVPAILRGKAGWSIIYASNNREIDSSHYSSNFRMPSHRARSKHTEEKTEAKGTTGGVVTGQYFWTTLYSGKVGPQKLLLLRRWGIIPGPTPVFPTLPAPHHCWLFILCLPAVFFSRFFIFPSRLLLYGWSTLIYPRSLILWPSEGDWQAMARG